jgi:oxygen-independent coproporphyrinogen-3 oxidase
MERYHKALCAEITRFGTQYQGSRHMQTIFMGGGTPSTYPPHLLLDMFDTLREMFMFDASSEISIEVNPGTVNKEKLAVWKQVGINRLSIGVQSLNDAVLKNLNRHQTAASVFDLLDQAAPLFDNISIDLILGLPDISPTEWQSLIEKVVTFPIKHVSVYFLTIHEDTPLYFKVNTNRISLPSDDMMVSLYHWTVDILAKHGFMQYELSNFAKEGYESRHNSVYWDRKPYKAFGLGACSFDGMMRFQNEKNLLRYLEHIEGGHDVTIFTEQLTPAQKHIEKLMLGLRRRAGVGMEAILEDLTKEQQDQFKKKVKVLQHKKLVKKQDGRLMLTPTGLVVENEVITQLTR